MNHSLAPILFALVTLPLLAACEGTVITGDDGEGGGEQCLMDPVCGPEEYQVDECWPGDGGACRSVSACGTEIFCQESYVECYEGPYCPTGYEVDACPADTSCYPVTECGYTIYCLDEVQCDAYPVCDQGDTEVSACPADAACYTATMCGTTIVCMDAGMPQHGCPESPPPSGTACDPSFSSFCDYPINGDCFESYACQSSSNGASWEPVGGGCSGNSG